MRKSLAILIATMALLLASAVPVSAHAPCNDVNEDGSPSGREYAEFHVAEMAKLGNIGGDGHVPGTHRGFSLCLGVH